MICSVLIPTRARVDRLHKTLVTIRASARVDQFEVILRVDYDDYETISRLKEFACYGNVRTVVGNRGIGYLDLQLLYDDCAQMARGDWVWFLNDDCGISGVGWADVLARKPMNKVICQSEFYQLGPSLYRDVVVGPFPMVPRGCWNQLGAPTVPFCTDAWLDSLVKEHGWKTNFIRGLTCKHARDNDEQLAVHRTGGVPPVSTHQFRKAFP